jgi:uncharacterized protein (DUF362 family)/NAD-dependent dihydropyrimidine dehydrogenase PreA subunit
VKKSVVNMAKTKIAIIRCESYDEKTVYDAIKKGINLIGGIGLFVKKNEKILLKVNCLAGANPDEAVTTHPTILNAMIKILEEKNISSIYGDSPGFGKPDSELKHAGFQDVADKHNIKLGDFNDGKTINFPEGIVCKKFNIANACLKSGGTDGIISLSKMKTHSLTRITGAVKNQFGCVYGLNKAGYHLSTPNPTNFSRMLIDLNLLIKARLFIMDGICAMEGNGPRGGKPVKMNCIIMSSDPVAIDSAFCRMINLDPVLVPTIKYGRIAGLGTYLPEELEYVGDPIESFINKRFDVTRKPVSNDLIKSIMPVFFRNMIYQKPIIDPKKCIKCGICVKACPVEGKALHFKDNKKDKPPVYNYNKCIRCYCCQEMCPQKAISVKGR